MIGCNGSMTSPLLCRLVHTALDSTAGTQDFFLPFGPPYAPDCTPAGPAAPLLSSAAYQPLHGFGTCVNTKSRHTSIGANHQQSDSNWAWGIYQVSPPGPMYATRSWGLSSPARIPFSGTCLLLPRSPLCIGCIASTVQSELDHFCCLA